MEKGLEEYLARLGLIDEQGMTPTGEQIFAALGEKLPKLKKNPPVTELTPAETQIAIKLLSRVGWQRTGTDLFEAIWHVVPMALSEQVVVRKIMGEWHVLMWRRPENDRNYPPFLHMLGGYPLVGETDMEWVGRVLQKETNLTLIHHYFMRRINMRPLTGWVPNHQLANMFFCEVEGEPTKGTWVPLGNVPEDTLGHHKYYAQLVRAHLMRLDTMRKHGGITYDYRIFAPEHQFAFVKLVYFDDEFYSHVMDCVSLDEAVALYEQYAAFGKMRHVVDDQGYQIL